MLIPISYLSGDKVTQYTPNEYLSMLSLNISSTVMFNGQSSFDMHAQS